jgi:hypothetical protein
VFRKASGPLKRAADDDDDDDDEAEEAWKARSASGAAPVVG